jgi:PII-like signaling protein
MHDGLFLRVYLSESDQIDGVPAMDAVLEICKQAGLHGVTVMRGIEGMGLHGVHSSSFLSLSSELPLVVEAVDGREKINHAVELLRPRIGHRLMATWPVSIIRTGEE